jgi:hypothetical protein
MATGTVVQSVPMAHGPPAAQVVVFVCTSKSKIPSPVASVVSVGAPAVVQLFYNV